MNRRLGLAPVLAGAALTLVLVTAPTASADGCGASALRVAGPAGTYEPVRANPAFDPCVDDYSAAYRARGRVGSVNVVADSLNATTDNDPPDTDFEDIFLTSSASVDSVRITSGANEIVAQGVTSMIRWACDRMFCNRPFSSSVASLTVNGIGIGPGTQPLDVPVPGLGTLHVNSESGPPATQRALWLEGVPGTADVVVAEASGCRGAAC
jgi:hypothetical protein